MVNPTTLLTRFAEEIGPLRPTPPILVSHSMTDGISAYAGEFEGRPWRAGGVEAGGVQRKEN